MILRQNEGTHLLGSNAHSSDAARVRIVLLRGGLPARGEKEKLPRPPTLVNQVTKRSQGAACLLQGSPAELSKRPSVERRLHTCYFLYLPCPGGGMADAEDLKSSGVLPHGGSSPPPGTILILYIQPTALTHAGDFCSASSSTLLRVCPILRRLPNVPQRTTRLIASAFSPRIQPAGNSTQARNKDAEARASNVHGAHFSAMNWRSVLSHALCPTCLRYSRR